MVLLKPHFLRSLHELLITEYRAQLASIILSERRHQMRHYLFQLLNSIVLVGWVQIIVQLDEFADPVAGEDVIGSDTHSLRRSVESPLSLLILIQLSSL